jgi:hypothetical protein
LKDLLIFLPGCINPNGMSLTVLQDGNSRKQQCVDSIRFYLDKTDIPILFVENSGNDISYLFRQEIQIGRLEILTFKGNDYDKKLGKGYGEMLILEHASIFSHFFKSASFIFKITGRYKVLNIGSYINRYYDNKNVFDLTCNFTKNLSYVDARFWGANPSFYTKILIKYKDMINDSKSMYFEHVLCKAAHEAIINGYKYSSLYHYPRYGGVSGTNGTTYNHSFRNWIPKEVLYRTLNRIQNFIQNRFDPNKSNYI